MRISIYGLYTIHIYFDISTIENNFYTSLGMKTNLELLTKSAAKIINEINSYTPILPLSNDSTCK